MGFFVHKKIILAVKRAEFVSDGMSYILLRGQWFHITVLRVQAPTEDKADDVKDSFYKELEHLFDKFPKYQKQILWPLVRKRTIPTEQLPPVGKI
jgi:hypothetical protein